MVLSLKKVLISDDIDPKCIQILQNNGIDVVKKTNMTKQQLISEIPVSEIKMCVTLPLILILLSLC